jgi:hypothetical protein
MSLVDLQLDLSGFGKSSICPHWLIDWGAIARGAAQAIASIPKYLRWVSKVTKN